MIRLRAILIIELLGNTILAVPFSHHWVKFVNQDGDIVVVNFNNIYSSSTNLENVDINKVHFHLYTKKNPTDSQRIFINNTEILHSSNYNISAETKLIVHGFLNNLNSPTIQTIKDNILSQKQGEYNIIAVDWSYYTMVYTDVLHKSKGVGLFIGELVTFLVSKGTKFENLHLIGHSLGAHACGFAGQSMKSGKVARITGLDPALPGFEEEDLSNRLDSQDALFVDCIHTCAGFLGFDDPICTADFYPNGGREQPGCQAFDFGGCSHGRSHDYFAESILTGHTFPSSTCLSQNFDKNDCFEGGALMGYPANDKYTGIFYTVTKSAFPFSLNVTESK